MIHPSCSLPFSLSFRLYFAFLHNHKIAKCQVECPRFISVIYATKRIRDVEERALSVNEILYTLLLLLFAGTIFCEFLRFGKNRKIKYPQKILPTYQAPWCICHIKLRDDFPFWIRHNLSLFIISAFKPQGFPFHHELKKVTDDGASFSSEI